MDRKNIPYGRQSIDADDIAAVVKALQSDWLTTGPLVGEFEAAVAAVTRAKFGVAVSSGTAALHAMTHALGIKPGDEVIVPSLTFAATANAVLYEGGTPVFADIDAETLLIDPREVEKKITKNTKAVIAVDYAGNPCDYDALRAITSGKKIAILSDACHSLGGTYKGRSVGTLADMSAFSFHPVKHVTTAEGGMVMTGEEAFAKKMKVFRNHGITSDHREREATGSCYYEMVELGFNYRLTDLQCALGISQLKKLGGWIEIRNEISARYSEAFRKLSFLELQRDQADSVNAHHLYVIRLRKGALSSSRDQVLAHLKKSGISANVHYPPVHLHPYYRNRFGYQKGALPVTESVYEELISLPMYPTMHAQDVSRVIDTVSALGGGKF